MSFQIIASCSRERELHGRTLSSHNITRHSVSFGPVTCRDAVRFVMARIANHDPHKSCHDSVDVYEVVRREQIHRTLTLVGTIASIRKPKGHTGFAQCSKGYTKNLAKIPRHSTI